MTTILYSRLWALAVWFLCASPVAGFDLVRTYAGATFFDGWDFFGGWDNLTLGDIWWLNSSDAFAQGLAYVNTNGNVILKVDNTSNVPWNQKRNSVRITTKDAYSVGSLWLFDIRHVPFGCSVWPAIWSFGPNWPFDGEIDIMEAINLQLDNQMALHTVGGCIQAPGSIQKGFTQQSNCNTPEGCVVVESQPNSYQSGFAAAGGGVWACQFDVSGIYIWFWSRPNIPTSITQPIGTTLDVSQWGPPSAAYPSTTCNITQFFSPQNLVIDITLCGVWAGVPAIYAATCHTGPTGQCYNDMVVGDGSKFNDAFFEISYVKIFTTGAPPTPTQPPVQQASSNSVQSTTITAATTTITTTFNNPGTRGPSPSDTGNDTQDSNPPPSGAVQISWSAWTWISSTSAMILIILTF